MSSQLLWRPQSISRDMSEMLQMQERARVASERDAEWQAFVLGPRRLSTAASSAPPATEAAIVAPQLPNLPLASERGPPPAFSPSGTTGQEIPHVENPALEAMKTEPNHAVLMEQHQDYPSEPSLAVATERDDGTSSRHESADAPFDDDATDDDQHDVNQPLDTELSGDSGASVRPTRNTKRQSTRSRTQASAAGVRKIRRRRMTKEEEARFAPEQLKDLKGTTAAKSRKMSASERDVMLHKRRLRNRESAARSREKQRKTMSDLFDDVDAVSAVASGLIRRVALAEAQSAQTCQKLDKLAAKLDSVLAENERLRKEHQRLSLPPQGAPQALPRIRRNPSSTLHLSFSNDTLDKLYAGNSGTAAPGPSIIGEAAPPRVSSGLLKIPSTLQFNLSSDKLDSMAFQSLPRNCSFLERILVDTNVGPSTIATSAAHGFSQSGTNLARLPVSSLAVNSQNQLL